MAASHHAQPALQEHIYPSCLLLGGTLATFVPGLGSLAEDLEAVGGDLELAPACYMGCFLSWTPGPVRGSLLWAVARAGLGREQPVPMWETVGTSPLCPCMGHGAEDLKADEEGVRAGEEAQSWGMGAHHRQCGGKKVQWGQEDSVKQRGPYCSISQRGKLSPGGHGKVGRATWLAAPPREASDSVPPSGCPTPLIPVPGSGAGPILQVNRPGLMTQPGPHSNSGLAWEVTLPTCNQPLPVPHPLSIGPDGCRWGVKGQFSGGLAKPGFVPLSVWTGRGPELCPFLSCRGRILSSWPSP